jgi:hypothetical protein
MAPWNRFNKSKLSLNDEGTDGIPIGSNSGHLKTVSPAGNDLLQSMNSDLQHTIRTQETRIKDQVQVIESSQHTIEGLKEEKELLQSQVWAFSEQLTQSRAEVEALRTNSEILDEHLQVLGVQAQVAERKINEQTQELSDRSNTIQILSGHNQKLQNQVADLESLVSVASKDTGADLQAFFAHYSDVKKELSQMTLKHSQSRRELGEMAMKLEEGNETRLASDKRLAEMQSENDSLKTVINELQKEASSLEVCQPQTLRALLTLRLVEQTWNLPKNDGLAEEFDQVQNWVPSGLSQNSFDEICSAAQIQSLAKTFPRGSSYNHFYQRLKLSVCAICSKAKFSFKIDARHSFNSVKWLNEYLGKTRYFSCCYEEVCKECFTAHLLVTLETKWWYKLGTLQWFPCPRESCEDALGIRCEADLETCLEQFCATNAEQHVKTSESGLLEIATLLTGYSDMSRPWRLDKLWRRLNPDPAAKSSKKRLGYTINC